MDRFEELAHVGGRTYIDPADVRGHIEAQERAAREEYAQQQKVYGEQQRANLRAAALEAAVRLALASPGGPNSNEVLVDARAFMAFLEGENAN